jgi:hypothetical protein
MRYEGQLLNILVNNFFKICRKDVDGTAFGVFCVIVVPAPVSRPYLYDIIGFFADDSASELAPGNEAFDENLSAVGPIFTG